MFVNDLILNACAKMTEMFISEKILTTSGNKFTSESCTNGDTLLSVVYRVTRLILTTGQIYS
jgi:hypothetical protein